MENNNLRLDIGDYSLELNELGWKLLDNDGSTKVDELKNFKNTIQHLQHQLHDKQSYIESLEDKIEEERVLRNNNEYQVTLIWLFIYNQYTVL